MYVFSRARIEFQKKIKRVLLAVAHIWSLHVVHEASFCGHQIDRIMILNHKPYEATEAFYEATDASKPCDATKACAHYETCKPYEATEAYEL